MKDRMKQRTRKNKEKEVVKVELGERNTRNQDKIKIVDHI
jgi:hypothetical protein